MRAALGAFAHAISICFWVAAVQCDPIDLNISSVGAPSALRAPTFNTSKRQSFKNLMPLAGQRGATRLVDSGLGSCSHNLDTEPPFYFLALEGMAKLFLSLWVFPVHGWNGPLTAFQLLFAFGMILMAFSTSIHDITQGFEYLKISWLFISVVWPSLLVGVACLIADFSANFCVKPEEQTKFWRYLSLLFFAIIPLLSLFFVDYQISQWATTDPAFFHAVNCGSLVWSSSSQIVSVVQSLALLTQTLNEAKRNHTIHWTRYVTLLPWILLNVIFYFPVLFLLFATHIIPGAIEFLPVTLAIAALLVCYAIVAKRVQRMTKHKNYSQQEMLLDERDARQQSWTGWLSNSWKYKFHHEEYLREREEAKYAEFELELSDVIFPIKAAAVPFMLVLKFLGEIIVRYRLGSSWLDSVCSTWSQRTLGQYTAHLFSSITGKVSLIQAIF